MEFRHAVQGRVARGISYGFSARTHLPGRPIVCKQLAILVKIGGTAPFRKTKPGRLLYQRQKIPVCNGNP